MSQNRISKKAMKDFKNKKFKVVKVSRTEFQLDNGDVFPIPFPMDYDPTVEQFQEFLDESKELVSQIVNKALKSKEAKNG